VLGDPEVDGDALGHEHLDVAEHRPRVNRHARALDVRFAQVEADVAEDGAPAAVAGDPPHAGAAQIAEDPRRDRGRRHEPAAHARANELGCGWQVAREVLELAARPRP